MRRNNNQICQFRKVLKQAYAANDKIFSSLKDAADAGQAYCDQLQCRMKGINTEYDSLRKECNALLSYARIVLEELPHVRAELRGLVLKCEMPTGDVHELRFRRIGITIFCEASFDNGFSANCEPIGMLVSEAGGTNVQAFVIETSVDRKSSKRYSYSKEFLFDQITQKIEWFLSEVGNRVPIYQLATKSSTRRKKKGAQ